jgi:hypothetical protein
MWIIVETCEDKIVWSVWSDVHNFDLRYFCNHHYYSAVNFNHKFFVFNTVNEINPFPANVENKMSS